MDSRFEMDRDLFPNRVIVGSETHPATMADGLGRRDPQPARDRRLHLDRLGLPRRGGHRPRRLRRRPADVAASAASYPWLTAWCGDIDITGHRRPQSYYREIVFGLRAEPYLAVRRPEHHGKEIAYASPWSWSDVVSTGAGTGTRARR